MTTAPEYEIVVIVPGEGTEGWEQLRQQCWDLRVEVYVQEQGYSLEDELDK